MSDKPVKKENKMGSMPVGRLILNMSWPAILSMLIQAMYNIVDTIFVSRVSEYAITAVTYCFPIQMMMISFGVGTAIGVNSLIARRLGANRYAEANQAASHGFRLSFMNWILFAVFGIFGAKIFIDAYTSNEFVLEYGTIYLQIVTIGCIFIMVQIMNEKILQATGNMVMPMLCSLLGAVINVFMDAVLIFGLLGFPKMGVTGAAVATVTSQFISCCLGLYLIFFRQQYIRINLRRFKWDKQIIKDIYAVGAPAILMQMIGSFMIIGINAIIAGISELGIAVMGIYQRIQSFVFMPCIGLNQGALPAMGFNYGARNPKRLMKAFRVSFFAAFVIMALGLIVFQLFPRQILGIFDPTPELIEMGVPALRIISICFVPASFGIMASSLFQATGHGMLSMFASLIRQFAGILPIALILSRTIGLTGVWASFPLAEILGTAYAIIGLVYLYRKEVKPMYDEICLKAH